MRQLFCLKTLFSEIPNLINEENDIIASGQGKKLV